MCIFISWSWICQLFWRLKAVITRKFYFFFIWFPIQYASFMCATVIAPNWHINTLRPRRNEQHFAGDIFKRIFFNENVSISIKISLKFVPKDPINNIPALVQIMAWHRLGDKPLSEPMMVSLPTHICVTRPQWVKSSSFGINENTTSHLVIRNACHWWGYFVIVH